MLQELLFEKLAVRSKNTITCTGLADSQRPGTMCFLGGSRFADAVNNNENIVACFVKPEDKKLLLPRVAPLVVDQPKACFFEFHDEYVASCSLPKTEIHPTARIHSTACIAEKGVIIGAGAEIKPFATIYEGVSIGENTVVDAGTVVGGDGFHVYENRQGRQCIVKHDGKVQVGENVYIGAQVTIDKGLMGRDTIIGNDVKIDNQVHIAHRVHIGVGSLVVAGACIAGSVTIGKNVWIGPQSVIANRITIDDDARILLGSVVIRRVKAREEVSGNFALQHKKHLLAGANDLLLS